MGVKKQSFAGYEPRALKGRGLGYVTSNRGACHMKGIMHLVELSDPTSIEGKPAILKGLQNLMAVHDSAGHCFFNIRAIAPDKMPEVVLATLESITGAGYDKESMLRAGERIWNLERLFNIRAGLTRKDDTLPPRMLTEPVPNGAAKGQVHELEVMLPEYYQLRGWDENGIPTPEKLAELGLEEEAGKTLKLVPVRQSRSRK
jgi:aldehyde:ferredoxin oxidoreductase